MKRTPALWVGTLLATTLLAGMGMFAVSSPAASYPSSCQETFPTSGPAGFAAPPQSTASYAIPVDVAGQVADIDVTISADHIQSAYFVFGPAEDFSSHNVSLVSLGGNVDLNGVTFDDEAAGQLSGASPYSGRYRPDSPLSALDGLQTAQPWRMQIDTYGSDTRLSGNWSITLTYADCVPDQDGDGLADTDDLCPASAADTRSGCPATTRTLTATYKLGAFRGALSSPVSECEGSQSVKIWKVRRGPDREIGTTTTGARGGYKLARTRHAGTYYAISPRAVATAIAECPRVTSDEHHLR